MRRMRNPHHEYKPDKKDPSKPPLYNGAIQKTYSSVTILDPIDPTLSCTNREPTKLNYTQKGRV